MLTQKSSGDVTFRSKKPRLRKILDFLYYRICRKFGFLYYRICRVFCAIHGLLLLYPLNFVHIFSIVETRQLQFDEIEQLMAKKSKRDSVLKETDAKFDASMEDLRKEFHQYKVAKENEIDKLRKDLAAAAKVCVGVVLGVLFCRSLCRCFELEGLKCLCIAIYIERTVASAFQINLFDCKLPIAFLVVLSGLGCSIKCTYVSIPTLLELGLKRRSIWK